MDGFKGEIRQTLQFRLSAWLSSVILLVALAAGIFSFYSAFQEAIELQDDQLRQIAHLINRHHLPLVGEESINAEQDADPESHIVVQQLLAPKSDGRVSRGEPTGFSVDLPEGMQTVFLAESSWRIFVKTMNSGARIAIGQRTSVQEEIAREGALRTLMPFLVLIPILLLLVGDLVRKIFKPLKSLALEIDHRPEEDLRSIAAVNLPTEIRPFVVAINRLLLRVSQSTAIQRRFIADAAHELRSPMTALSLHAERLNEAEMSPEAGARLASLRKGIQRNRGLLEQLLTLARVQESSRTPLEMVSVQQVFRHVLEDLLPLAEAKHIDLGVVDPLDANVLAPEVDLITLVKNLVDNAIRYTPDYGRIDLSVETSESRVLVQIADTGPGIPEEERGRVFDPFYRVLGIDEMGSGLGLSIVKTIATRIGANVTLGYANEKTKSGLRVRVVLPAVRSFG